MVTWNVQTFPKTRDTIRVLAQTIERLDLDLIGIQEIQEPNSFDALLDALPGYGGAQVFDPDNFLRVGILYKRSRLRVSEIERLFSDQWFPFPRPPLKARVELINTSSTSTTAGAPIFDFTFVVLHLKAQRDARSQSRRREACLILDDWVQDQLRSGEDRDIILVGDYNDRLTDPPWDNVFTPFFENPRSYTFLTLPLANAQASSYIPFPGLIDHILVTTDTMEAYEFGHTEVLHLEDEVPDYLDIISDHRPVMSTFVIVPP